MVVGSLMYKKVPGGLATELIKNKSKNKCVHVWKGIRQNGVLRIPKTRSGSVYTNQWRRTGTSGGSIKLL